MSGEASRRGRPEEVTGTDAEPKAGERTSWPGRFARRFLMISGVLLLGRAALPIIGGEIVEGALDRTPGLRSELAHLELDFAQPAVGVEDFRLRRRPAARDPAPGGEGEVAEDLVLHVGRIDLATRWDAILGGPLVGEVIVDAPRVYARLSESADVEAQPTGPSWRRTLEDALPFELERLAVRNGHLSLTTEAVPDAELIVTDVHLEAFGASNVESPGEPNTVHVEIAGRPFGLGTLEALVRMRSLAHPFDLDLDAAIRDVPLPALNPWMLSGVPVDAEAGRVSVFTELVVMEGEIDGYVKVVLEAVDLFRFGEIDDPDEADGAFWDALSDLGAEILENPAADTTAMRVPVSGRIDDVEADAWSVVGSLLHNAFVVAIRPAIEGSIVPGRLTPGSVGSASRNSDT